MLEVLLIIFLAKKIGRMAENKDHKKGGYIAMFVIFWVLGEILGGVAGAFATRSGGLEIYIFAIVGAGSGTAISFIIVSSLTDRTIVKEPVASNTDEGFLHLQ